MLLLSIIHHYLLWHYSRAFGEIKHVAKSLIWFVINFFSLPQLLRSLVAPYRRITEGRGKTFDLEDLAGFLLINLISRIIGLILRLTIIMIGVLALLLLFSLIILTFIMWTIAPLFLLVCLLLGARLLIPV